MFRSDIEILRRSSPARTGKRFVCWVTDMVLVVLLAELLFMGFFQFARNTGKYQSAEQTVAEEIAYYERLTEETHIVEYVDGSRVATDVVVLKNLYRAICLSYQVFGSAQQPNFSFGADHQVTVNGVHSPENDNIAYFYTRYLKENPGMVTAAGGDVFEIYQKAFGDDAAFMFSFNAELSDIPVLNTQVAYYLFHYLFVDSSDSIGQTGATYYEAYYNGYANMLEEAEQLILQSEPYYSTHYLSYKEAYCAQARYTNIALVLSVLTAGLMVLLIPKYLFQNEKTIGYLLFGLGVVGTDGRKNEWYVPLVKTALACVGAVPLTFLMYLFPPFNGGFEAMFVPVTPDSKISLALVILVITVLGGTANAVGLFTPRRQNLWNLIFRDLVVDARRADEGGRDETNHGRPY